MKIAHVTAHLGGGVGKAHASLRAAMPDGVHQTYLLLEPPRDNRYADEIMSLGGEVIVVADLEEVARRTSEADIVQFEFWNHPKLFECLALADFAPMRTVFWAHVSGLFRPVIPPGLMSAAERFVFTSPASLSLLDGLAEEIRSKAAAIGSGFGFSGLGQSGKPGAPIAYLGTVDFIKMHPGFFDAIDALEGDVTAAVWGACAPDSAVREKARGMRHPDRIRLMGQTADPRSALGGSEIFFYPLQPDHYGTAENALIEAMSLGLAPVVLGNPAECAIVQHEETGLIAASIEEAYRHLENLLRDPQKRMRLGAAARRHAEAYFTAEKSAQAFIALWRAALEAQKRQTDFAAIIGKTPLDWYSATQGLADEIALDDGDDRESKGTLAHFRAAFPEHPCWRPPKA